MSVDAPAKVNLDLHVTGRIGSGPRAGYHRIDSLIVFAEIGDVLTLEPGADLALETEGPFAPALPAADDNLVLGAARTLRARAGVGAGALVRLAKRLPVAAGLGGGSADAAAALRGLDRLWGLDLDRDRLQEIAAELGADVPVCLEGKPAVVGGYGERVLPAPTLPRGLWLVLANPGVEVSTARVFARLGGPFRAVPRRPAGYADAAQLAAALAQARSDLEAPARGLAPEIGQVLEALEGRPGCLIARLSGSGATCFALFGEKRPAAAATEALQCRNPGWWVTRTRILEASPDGLPQP